MLNLENLTSWNETNYELSTPEDDFPLFTNSSTLSNITNITKSLPDDDVEVEPHLNVPYAIMETLVAVVAVIGNALVIIVFYRERRLRRRTNYYIISLALADFLVGLLGIPFAILASVGLPKNLYACLFTTSSLVVLCTISIFCLVAVSIDRYWAILHPLAYSRNVRTKTAIGIISLCWVFGSVIGFLPVFGWHNGTEDEQCFFTEIMDYNYLVFLYFTTIITPSIILAVFYGLIYRVILKQVNKTSSSLRLSSTGLDSKVSTMKHSSSETHVLRLLNSAAQKREVKATQNLSIIVAFFMICWIPLYTINCINAFCQECVRNASITYFGIILSHLNSAINPLLYAYHLKDFRGALIRLFTCNNVDTHYRPSFISQQQQRITSQMNQRRSYQPRTYIDSPVYKRQQYQMKTITEGNSHIPNNGDLNFFRDTDLSISAIESSPQLRRITSSQSNRIYIISDNHEKNHTVEPQPSSLYNNIVNRCNQEKDKE